MDGEGSEDRDFNFNLRAISYEDFLSVMKYIFPSVCSGLNEVGKFILKK